MCIHLFFFYTNTVWWGAKWSKNTWLAKMLICNTRRMYRFLQKMFMYYYYLSLFFSQLLAKIKTSLNIFENHCILWEQQFICQFYFALNYQLKHQNHTLKRKPIYTSFLENSYGTFELLNKLMLIFTLTSHLLQTHWWSWPAPYSLVQDTGPQSDNSHPKQAQTTQNPQLILIPYSNRLYSSCCIYC